MTEISLVIGVLRAREKLDFAKVGDFEEPKSY